MIKYIFLFFLASMPLLGFSHANGCSKSSSYCIYKDETTADVVGNFATLILDNMIVENSIKGSFAKADIKNSNINSINSRIASLNIQNSTLYKDILGNMASIHFTNSTIQNLKASVHKIFLKNSTVNNIKIDNRDHEMLIKLSDQSVILGDVTFLKHRGKVCLTDETSSIKGKVINGDILNDKCEERWDYWNN